jgi:hypothetical protein
MIESDRAERIGPLALNIQWLHICEIRSGSRVRVEGDRFN